MGAFTREGKSPFWYIVYQDRPGHQKQEATDILVDFRRRRATESLTFQRPSTTSSS